MNHITSGFIYKSLFCFLKKRLLPKGKVYSLKSRVTIMFITGSIITFVLTSSVSYYTITSILDNKIERGIDISLNQVSKDIEMTLNNLVTVAKQLSYEGIIGNDIDNYLTSTSYADKRIYFENINMYLNLIDYTDQNIGLHFYYNTESKDLLFPNNTINNTFQKNQMSLLTKYNIHQTFLKNSKGIVLSVSRPFNIFQDSGLNIYVETSVKTLTNILKNNQQGMNISYVIVNSSNQIVYSEMNDILTEDSTIENKYMKSGRFQIGTHYLFKNKSAQGWLIIAAIKKSDFNKEIREWIIRLCALGILLMLVSLALGLIMWRSVYTPMKAFKTEIGLMADNNFNSAVIRTNIVEFDLVLEQFYHMKCRVLHLLQEIRQKERDKRHLEVDKLLSQINPHFLYNTLNSVQWMARSYGQKDIEKMVSILIRLLRYNLGKEGSIVPIKLEISALKDYISLQKIRNDNQFVVQFNIDEQVLNLSIPRFILQPLIENSIYHGLNNGKGIIEVTIRYDDLGYVEFLVKDNGPGISPEILEQLLEGEERKYTEFGLGIGLNYVNKMLSINYNDSCKLHIESIMGYGTTFKFMIPFYKEEIKYEENPDSR